MPSNSRRRPLASARSDLKNSKFSLRGFVLRLQVLVWTVSNCTCQQSSSSFFNFEISKRVEERLQFFLRQPETVQEIVQNYRTNQLFEYGMTAPDREEFIRLIFSLPDSILPSKIFYCGLEDGTNIGTWDEYGFYREPGNSGYTIDSVLNHNIFANNVNYKHFVSCFHWQNGSKHNCKFEPGATYVKYSCENEDGNDNNDNDEERCKPIYEPCSGDDTVLCKQYTFETVGEDDVPRGYVPLTSFCLDATGLFTEEPGKALDYNGAGTLGDCLYYDSDSIVDGSFPESDTGETLDYAFCTGKTDEECNRMFRGSFYSEIYDPRYRPWYTDTKRLLKPNWAAPYPFSGTSDTGITLSYPVFTNIDDDGTTRRFDGVCAVDYRLTDFTNFLVETYQNSTTLIVLFEAEPPHRVIGASTGTDPIRNGTHLSIDNFYDPGPDGNPLDEVLVQAFREQQDQGYPDGRLITVKISDEIDSDVYASQSTYFKYPNIEGLEWRVVIVSRGVRSDQDEILPGSSTFALVLTLATAGVVLCAFFCVILYRKRTSRAVIFGDWRFTCAFILGCILLNTSSYALVGPITDVTCLLRMWMFHITFAIALSPLFVKVYRMYLLAGTAQRTLRTTISNQKAASWTLPIILFQIVILVISTFVFPPMAHEIIENNEGEELVLQRIVCATNNPAMLIVRFTFEGCLILVGCILAYKTRDLKQGFGESKQLIFAMYNIALVMVIIGVVIGFVDMDESSKCLLRTIGVLWGTGFSTAAFVVPRMVQVQKSARIASSLRSFSRSNGASFRISGVLEANGVNNVSTDQGAKSSRTEEGLPTSSSHGKLEAGLPTSSLHEKMEAALAESPEQEELIGER